MAKKVISENRVPRERTADAAEKLAEKFGLDPERVMCDFRTGTVMVRVEELEELLADPQRGAV